MHEMALAESLVELIEETARAHQAKRVAIVRLAIGALACVQPEALEFCFDAVSRGAIAEGARLEIVRTEGRGWCLDCETSVAVQERYGDCPECGGRHVQMTAGDEMRLLELEID